MVTVMIKFMVNVLMLKKSSIRKTVASILIGVRVVIGHYWSQVISIHSFLKSHIVIN